MQQFALVQRAVAIELSSTSRASFSRVGPISGLASRTRLVTLSTPATAG